LHLRPEAVNVSLKEMATNAVIWWMEVTDDALSDRFS
jgi:hypothetical protein